MFEACSSCSWLPDEETCLVCFHRQEVLEAHAGFVRLGVISKKQPLAVLKGPCCRGLSCFFSSTFVLDQIL